MKAAELLDIKIKQLLAQLRRQIGLGIVQKGSDVVLQRPFASALIIQEKRLTVAQHDVAGLKIAVQEIVAIRAQQESRQAVEIVFQCLLVERNPGQAQKVILEIIQVPGNGLPVKAVLADNKRCNSDRVRPRSESAATPPQLCDKPPPLAEQSSPRRDSSRETQTASYRPRSSSR